jgi:hypothetical protein
MGPQRWADTFGEEKNVFPVLGIQPLFFGNQACRLVIIPTLLEAVDNQTLLSLNTQNMKKPFDVLTSIVSFIWAPSTRGGVAYGVRTLSTNCNSY